MRASSWPARCGAARAINVILVDPPKFGRGPEGEVWDTFSAPGAAAAAIAPPLLAPGRAALVLTYLCHPRLGAGERTLLVPRYASPAVRGTTESGGAGRGGGPAGALLPTSLFTRWASGDGAP